MKIGDLVKWLGFPGATVHAMEPENTIGIIISRQYCHDGEYRWDVLWKDGTIGYRLYSQTIGLIV